MCIEATELPFHPRQVLPEHTGLPHTSSEEPLQKTNKQKHSRGHFSSRLTVKSEVTDWESDLKTWWVFNSIRPHYWAEGDHWIDGWSLCTVTSCKSQQQSQAKNWWCSPCLLSTVYLNLSKGQINWKDQYTKEDSIPATYLQRHNGWRSCQSLFFSLLDWWPWVKEMDHRDALKWPFSCTFSIDMTFNKAHVHQSWTAEGSFPPEPKSWLRRTDIRYMSSTIPGIIS